MAAVTAEPDERPVAIIAARYPPAPGGVERHVQRLAEGLIARGIPVDVLVTDPTGELPAAETRDGVTVRRFPTLGRNEVWFISPRLFRWLRRNAGRYRLLHAHGYHTTMPRIAALAVRRDALWLGVTPRAHGTQYAPFPPPA